MKKQINIIIYTLALWLLHRTPFVFMEDRHTIMVAKPNSNKVIPNPKNPERVVLRDSSGKFTSLKRL